MQLSDITVRELYKLTDSSSLAQKIKLLGNKPIAGVFIDTSKDQIKVVFDAKYIIVTLDNQSGVLKHSCTSCANELSSSSNCAHIIMSIAAYFIAVKNFQSLINFKLDENYFNALKQDFEKPQSYVEFLASQNRSTPRKPNSLRELPNQDTIHGFDNKISSFLDYFNEEYEEDEDEIYDIEFCNDPELGTTIEVFTDELPAKALSSIERNTTSEYLDVVVLKNKSSLKKILSQIPESFSIGWQTCDYDIDDDENYSLVLPEDSSEYEFILQFNEDRDEPYQNCTVTVRYKYGEEPIEDFYLNAFGHLILDLEQIDEDREYEVAFHENLPSRYVAEKFMHWIRDLSPHEFHPLFFNIIDITSEIPTLMLERAISEDKAINWQKILPNFLSLRDKPFQLIESNGNDLDWSFEISPDFSFTNDSHLYAYLKVKQGDIEYNASAPFSNLIDIIIDLYREEYAFFKAKKRRSLFKSSLYNLANSSLEPTNWLAEFNSPEKELKPLLKQFIHSYKKLPKQCYFFNPQKGTILKIHHRPKLYLELLTQFLRDIKEIIDFPILHLDGQLQAATKNDLYTAHLNDLLGLTQKHGIQLKIDGKKVQQSRLNIQINIDPNKNKLDWFELKPDIRVETFKLSHDDWARILSSENGLVEINDQHFLIDIKSRSQLEKVSQSLFKNDHQKKLKSEQSDELLECNRLQIFDWLPLIAEGVDVNLPKELDDIVQSLKNFKKLPHLKLPHGLDDILRPYQKKGVAWLAFHYKHEFGACLADDMGLGKTLQVIAFISWLSFDKKRVKTQCRGKTSLIVVPPSLVFNWQSEFERFAPHIQVNDYVGSNRSMDVFNESDVVITTYDIVRNDTSTLKEIDFHLLIFDEAQNMKNFQANRTKAALQLKAQFRVCLTGTPLENNISEYFSIMSMAIPGIMESHDEFRQRYKIGDNTLIKRAETFLLRRTKDKILKDLPPKQENDVYLNMGEKQREYYTRFTQMVKGEIESAYKDKTNAQAHIIALAAITRLRQVCISPALVDPNYKEKAPKLEFVADKLKELMEEGHAGLLFSQFTKALDALEVILKAKKIPYLRMDGKTPTKKRKTLVESFQETDAYPVFLISLKTGGVGLNLTRANYVYHLDPWWNPAVENQATDRAHRIGQKQTVFIQRLLMRGSIEEKMMVLKKEKQDLFDEIINSNEKKSNTGLLSKDQILQLIS